jgi:hypothetical protein
LNTSGSSGTALRVTRRPAPANSTASFPSIPAVNRAGRTEHFEVFYERSFGETGRSVGATILDRAESDLWTLSGVFGLPLPGHPAGPEADRFVVVLARLDEDRRTYREDRVIFCDLQTTPRPEPRQSSFYVAFQLAAVLAERAGWEAPIGEALARTIATAIYPRRIVGFATAPVWLDGDRVDVFDGPLGAGLAATGGAVLFVNFLHYQLGFPWRHIAATPEPDLGAVARRLTGSGTRAEEFRSLMDSCFPSGLPSRLIGDNPFPIDPPEALSAALVDEELWKR